MFDDINQRTDEIAIELNGEIVHGNSPAVAEGNLPPIGMRPADDAPRTDWIAYLVQLGANGAYLESSEMTVIDFMIFAESLGG